MQQQVCQRNKLESADIDPMHIHVYRPNIPQSQHSKPKAKRRINTRRNDT